MTDEDMDHVIKLAKERPEDICLAEHPNCCCPDAPQKGKEEWERELSCSCHGIGPEGGGHWSDCPLYEDNLFPFIHNLANQKLKEGMERAHKAVEKRSKEPFTQYGTCSELHFGDALDAIREEMERLSQPKE